MIASRVDTSKGTVAYEMVLSMAALGHAVISEDLDSFEDKMYLQQALEDPAAANADTIDGILSNFYVARKPGSKAKGKVRLALTEKRNYFVAENSEFRTLEGQKYFTTTSTNKTADELFIDGEDYYFFVDVIAEAVGSQYVVAKDTQFETEILSGSIDTATAFKDFSSGIDEETNSEILGRTPLVLGARALSHTQAITTLLQEQFPDIRQLTVIGYGNREMLRDSNNIGFKVGGKIDIYIRTATQPLTSIITKTTDANGEVVLDSVDDGEVPILRVNNIALESTPLNTTEDFEVEVESSLANPTWYRFSI